MIRCDTSLTAAALAPLVRRAAALAVDKARLLRRSWEPSRGTPVFTVSGRYTSRGWTEWTQGFQFGSPSCSSTPPATSDFLGIGRPSTVRAHGPARHATSACTTTASTTSAPTATCCRLMREGRHRRRTRGSGDFYELALKVSRRGAGRALDRSIAPDGGGYIYSFNGPHSLFVDTIRSLRALGVCRTSSATC